MGRGRCDFYYLVPTVRFFYLSLLSGWEVRYLVYWGQSDQFSDNYLFSMQYFDPADVLLLQAKFEIEQSLVWKYYCGFLEL